MGGRISKLGAAASGLDVAEKAAVRLRLIPLAEPASTGFQSFVKRLLLLLALLLPAVLLRAADEVDARSLRGKIMCGYQGWFRCSGDISGIGWSHWSRDAGHIDVNTLTFEMWPDMSEYPPEERFEAPGFTDAGGQQAFLFSSDQPGTVRRHFEWLRQYGIDGVWLQHFAVDLPGGPLEKLYPSRRRVLENVREAAAATGRTWALSFDIAGMPGSDIVTSVTGEWKRLVDQGVVTGDHYLHDGGKPVVQIWGFYYRNRGNAMTAATANALIDFFKAPGPYNAFLAGGGDWDWRQNPDPEWQTFFRRFDAWSPWNVGNTSLDAEGLRHAATGSWDEDRKECEKCGMLWLPVVYPGFSWDNLQRKAPGSTLIPRRGGNFFWEQFHTLSRLNTQSAYIAMFDEVDEGTAIFKIAPNPPKPGHFLDPEGMPSDWYLRLAGEAAGRLRARGEVPLSIPLQP